MIVISLVLVFPQWLNFGIAVEVAKPGAAPPEKLRVFPFEHPKLNTSNDGYASELKNKFCKYIFCVCSCPCAYCGCKNPPPSAPALPTNVLPTIAPAND